MSLGLIAGSCLSGRHRPENILHHILSLLFIPSALATEGFCKSLPHAYALFALTGIGRESKDFCSGRN
jgi:hypothetical protein